MQNPLAILATAATSTKGPPPVDTWNPPFCGDIDMRIARDGTWHYLGGPIGRPAMVKLFASILRKDPEGFRLVTPVEKVGIVVEDAPFLAVEMLVLPGPALNFRTNVDDWVEAGAEHPLRFDHGPAGGIKPYVHVRGGLWALLTRALSYDLFALGETQRQVATPRKDPANGRNVVANERKGVANGRYGAQTRGAFFPFPAEALE